MKLATISTVFALGVLAACGRVPDETLVTSYGDTAPPATSQSETSAAAPAPQTPSSQATDAPAADSNVEADGEMPGPGALAFSPAQEGGEAAAADVPAPDDQNAQVAALPEQDAEPVSEDTGTPAELAARTPDQPAAQALGQSYGVQLAAYRQASGAEAVWNGLLRAHPDLLAELSKTVRRADLGATRGVVHQLRVGPFAGEAEARALCETLKKRGTDCFVVAPRRQAREGG